jgi:DNA-binding transcriptional regulator YiaG
MTAVVVSFAFWASLNVPSVTAPFHDEISSPITSYLPSSVGETTVVSQPISVREENKSWMTVAELRDYTNLTAAQIGRLFDVSRRAVHYWIAGDAMAKEHQERLSRIQQVVFALEGKTPEERRLELLSSSGGPSIFHRLVREIPEAPIIQMNALAARDQF